MLWQLPLFVRKKVLLRDFAHDFLLLRCPSYS